VDYFGGLANNLSYLQSVEPWRASRSPSGPRSSGCC
jgi:hypothetical protein